MAKRRISNKRIAKRDALKKRHRCTGADCKYCAQRRTAAASTGGDVPATPIVNPNPAQRPRKRQDDLSVYAVFRDANGVAYLRVAYTTRGAAFIVNKGFNVELIDVDRRSTTTLSMQAVAGASILESAKRLLRPLNDQCTISQRAKEHLNEIVNDERILDMDTKKNTKATKPAPKFAAPANVKETSKAKTAAAKPAAKANGKAAKQPREHVERTVTLKRMPKENSEKDHLPKQANAILEVLKAGKGKLTTTALFAGMEKKIESKQTMSALWAFYQKRLVDGGFIAIA